MVLLKEKKKCLGEAWDIATNWKKNSIFSVCMRLVIKKVNSSILWIYHYMYFDTKKA